MKFTLNNQGVADVAKGDGIRKLVDERAAAISAKGAQYAPGSQGKNIRQGPTELGDDGEWHGSVVWDSSIWHIIEFGSVNNPPYRPLTRAAQEHGTFTDTGKR